MELDLTDRSIIVTGAGSGIGFEATRQLLAEGARVTGIDINVADLRSLAVTAPNLAVLEADLTTVSTASRARELALDAHRHVDGLISCAAVAPVRSSVLEGSDDDWRRTIDVNFLSLVRLCRELVPVMKGAGGGTIVSVASDAGRMPDPFFAEYNVTKASILMFMKALSIEVGPDNIRVNTVSPGPVRTPMWDRPGGFTESLAEAYGMEPEDAIKHFALEVRRLPLRRLGSPAEVASVLLFLTSSRSSFVTGAEYTVNGGSIPTV